VLTSRRAAVALALALSLLAGRAGAQDDEPDDVLRLPERLTVGVADDLLGQLSPDGQTLYFVSNRNTTNQLFAQTIADGRARQLFDDDADVTWPRISPDGKWLLYISFGERAAGQLCIRNLPDAGTRRCLDDSSAALQAEWIDAGRVALVSRQSVQGDLRLLEVSVASTLAESVSGIRVTQAFVRHEVNAGFFQKLIDVHGENNVGVAQASAVFVPLLQLKSQLFLGAMALLGAFGAQQQHVRRRQIAGDLHRQAVLVVFLLQRDHGLAAAALGRLLAFVVIARLVGGDAENPRLQPAAALERADILDDSQECILTNLLHVFA